MPATTAGALKTLIESLGLGLAAYADQAPQQIKRPYVVIYEQIHVSPDASGDAKLGTGVETVQVDVFQDWRDLVTGKLQENYTLTAQLRRALHFSRLSISGLLTYAVLVRGSTRTLDEAGNEVHDIITLEVLREL